MWRRLMVQMSVAMLLVLPGAALEASSSEVLFGHPWSFSNVDGAPIEVAGSITFTAAVPAPEDCGAVAAAGAPQDCTALDVAATLACGHVLNAQLVMAGDRLLALGVATGHAQCPGSELIDSVADVLMQVRRLQIVDGVLKLSDESGKVRLSLIAAAVGHLTEAGLFGHPWSFASLDGAAVDVAGSITFSSTERDPGDCAKVAAPDAPVACTALDAKGKVSCGYINAEMIMAGDRLFVPSVVSSNNQCSEGALIDALADALMQVRQFQVADGVLELSDKSGRIRLGLSAAAAKRTDVPPSPKAEPWDNRFNLACKARDWAPSGLTTEEEVGRACLCIEGSLPAFGVPYDAAGYPVFADFYRGKISEMQLNTAIPNGVKMLAGAVNSCLGPPGPRWQAPGGDCKDTTVIVCLLPKS